MKIKALLVILLFIAPFFTKAQTVEISASESDAKIVVDGQLLGTGNMKIKVPKNSCVNVKVQKAGYLKYEQTFCNKKGMADPPKKQFFDMKKDDAEEASIKTDQANIDFSIEVNKKQDPTEVWKKVNQIVTDYFDAIEVADKETSYLRTAWSIQSFMQNTIRTRLIIKLAKSEPLTYKVKLVSEYSGSALTSVKSDELFHDWDRVLRKYQNVISDFTTRLGNQ
ncbi:hypothetical protein SAMN05216464_10989 [Mucilaginibacter pineti]|uniref:PEGA domain-containing protein n=1 Tax=Mucilaginibacter pineti TaxID=1391627 RepID=A0A1G7FJZ4_9SPHI|nr:hypothetical protein [Mucilaginibacter pineti]SDE76150.1 hypothetical protein SAMN05216464_10989 [Mucilaginibacter pineti]